MTMSNNNNMDDTSLGQSNAAVAMANSAIDNARRAAATSRSRREEEYTATPTEMYRSQFDRPSTPKLHPVPGTAEYVKNDYAHLSFKGGAGDKSSGSVSTELDLKHNNNAYHVVATLVTDRLLPKLAANSSYYTVSQADVEFFGQMLPPSVRRAFVEALRYRLENNKSSLGEFTPLEKITMQCQMLGLNRERNVLLDLGKGSGMTYSVHNSSNMDIMQAPPSDRYGTTALSNGVNFGLTSPLSTNSTSNNNEVAAESLARQQIMAEINETKFLLKDAVTPEATSFWKKHLDELSQRLVALSQEEQIRNAAGRTNTNASLYGARGLHVNPENRDESTITYDKVKQHYVTPKIASREEYLENNRKMREEAGLQLPKSYTPPDQVLEAQVEMVGSCSENNKQEELPVCDVVAPSDLPGGYKFEAQLGDHKFLAMVPPGGVAKGQRFVSTMQELETIQIPVPLGGWRDTTCDCFSNGIFHPLFLNTIFAPCVALGQIMTRTGLDWTGEPTSKPVSSLSCVNMSVMLSFWLTMNASAAFMFRVRWERGMDIGIEFLAAFIVFNLLSWCYMVNITRNVRASIRHKYEIPAERCGLYEDCMCATLCTPCTICQMGRHTGDFETYRGTWCSATGLPRQVELMPPTFYDADQYQNVDADVV